MIALMDKETAPTLMPVPGVDLAEYKRALVERFANPAIVDTNQRVNSDAPINLLLDPIRDRLARDEAIPLLALALAAWCRRVSGVGEDGKPIMVVHPLAPLLAERARQGSGDPDAFAGDRRGVRPARPRSAADRRGRGLAGTAPCRGRRSLARRRRRTRLLLRQRNS
jgi:mannitol 2-dehydrogenase